MVNYNQSMEKIEQKDVKKEAVKQFIIEMEDMITDPKFGYLDFDTTVIDKLRQGQKIKFDKWFEQLLVKVAQDFRLTWQEIDLLKKEIFE